jgi:Ser/Thr protein kinase RdoA (MazF antagonist)
MVKKTLCLILIYVFIFSDVGYCLRPAATGYMQGMPVPVTGKAYYGDINQLVSTIIDCEKPAKRNHIISFIYYNNSTKDVEIALRIVLNAQYYGKGRILEELTNYERLDFISECLFAALKRADSLVLSNFLLEMLKYNKRYLLPEAERLIRSFLTVYSIKNPVKIATTFAMYRGQNKIQPFSEENNIGQDFLRAKIRQLGWLYGVNPNVTSQLIAVQDGDDSGFSTDGLKTIDVAEKIAREDFPELLHSQGLIFLELPQAVKLKIGSVKGGANTYGMRWAIEHGADYVIYTDGDLATHLSQEGLLLEDIISGKSDVSIGSIKIEKSLVSGRKLTRRILTPLYILLAKLILPELYGISDLQRSFKCYSRDVLEIILPVDKKYNFEKHFLYDYLPEPIYLERFVYNFSFDTQLLARAIQCGFIVTQHPIAWIDFPSGSTVRKKDILAMVKGLFLQRIYLTFYGKRYRQDAENYFAYKKIKQARGKGHEISMSGSTKARDLYFRDIPVQEKIKIVLENYDLGAHSIDDIEFKFLPGVPSRPPVLIITPKGKFVIKYEASNIDAARFIVSFVLRLKSLNYPVIGMIKSTKDEALDIDNYWVKPREGYFLTLEEYVAAETHNRLGANTKEMAQLGGFIASLHNGLSGFSPAGAKEEKRAIDVISYRKELERRYEQVKNIFFDYKVKEWAEYMKQSYPRLHYISSTVFEKLFKGEQLLYGFFDLMDKEMAEISAGLSLENYEMLPKSVIPGDVNFSNILFNDKGSIEAVFDWDKSRFQARVEDLKNPIMALPQGEGRIYSMESVIALVIGYQLSASEKLSRAELAAVPEIIGATFLWLACSYFLLTMDRLDSDNSFRRVAEKDMALFRRFRNEKAFLKFILQDIDRLIKQFHLLSPADVEDELVLEIISNKKHFFCIDSAA